MKVASTTCPPLQLNCITPSSANPSPSLSASDLTQYLRMGYDDR